MTTPPKSIPLHLFFVHLFIIATLSGCATYGKDGMKPSGPVVANWFPLIVAPAPFDPPNSVPDLSLLDPDFEEPSSVVAWARPVAPEGTINELFTPNGQNLVYLALHPNTRIFSLYTVSLAGGAPVELSRGHAPEEFFYPTITPDSSRVIYHTLAGRRGLYSVALDGTKEMKLADDRIHEVALSPDGQWVVFWGEGEQSGDGLYSVPVTGGVPVLLGYGLPSSGSYKISPDSRYVLYLGTKEVGVGQPLELYRVPIQGGALVQLSQGELLLRGGPTFLITPDSQNVIFGNLYIVPINGGTPVQLNHTASANSRYNEYATPPYITPDGKNLLFIAGDTEGNNSSLYSVPLAGGSPLQLNGPLGEGERVLNFSISPSGQQVLYWQGLRNQQEALPPYAVPLAGGDPVALPTFDWFRQSEDGRWLIYGVRLETPGFDLYSVATAGGAPVKLNGPVPTNSAVAYAGISPDSSTVFYLTSKDAGGGMPVFDGLYQLPITGGEAREVTGVDGRDRVFGFTFAPDGQTLLATVDYDDNGRYALYAFPAEPPPAPNSD